MICSYLFLTFLTDFFCRRGAPGTQAATGLDVAFDPLCLGLQVILAESSDPAQYGLAAQVLVVAAQHTIE